MKHFYILVVLSLFSINLKAQCFADAGPDQTICPGQSVLLKVATNAQTIYWSPTGQTTMEITVSPTVTTTYTVTVSDSMVGQCSDQVVVIVTSGSTFTGSLDTTSKTTISCPLACNGSLTVNVTGGTPPYTFEWSTGQTGPSVQGLCGGSYSVTISDAGTCGGSVTKNFYISSAGSNPSIYGQIAAAGGSLNYGMAELFKLDSKGDFVYSNSTYVTSGNYYFQSVTPGSYILSVSADSTASDLMKTYYNGVARWDLADTIVAACNTSFPANFTMLQEMILNGPGTITGQIKVAPRNSPGDPIPGVDVSLEQNPGGITIAQTQTDLNGEFAFTGVPVGDYKIFVDMTGMVMTAETPVTITSSNTSSVNNIFTVDSATNVINAPMSLVTLKELKGSLKIYPNPVIAQSVVTLDLDSRVEVKLVIVDMLGNVVRELCDQYVTGRLELPVIGAADLSSGVYFLKGNVGAESVHQKFVISK